MVKSIDILEEEIKDMAINDGASIVLPINPEEIVIANWVRLKCQFGCPNYAKKLSCPPYSPKPEDTRKVIDEYSKAYLIGYEGSTIFTKYNTENMGELFPLVLKDIRKSLFEIEKHAFLSGYYKSFVYGFCGPCTICDRCVVEDGILTCKYATESRPSMEASGIDVFKTVKNAGLNLEVQSSRNLNDLRMYTLLLIE
jgi:predicted metal-binding protein